MDIIMIPFHDCKKWIKEGFRTRDAHLVEHFCKDKRVEKILVINRPTSLAEIVLKQSTWQTRKLDNNVRPIYREKNYEVSKWNKKIYCLDIYLSDFFKVIKEKKLWWFSAFENKLVLDIIKKVTEQLEFKDIVLLLQNPMAIGVIKSVNYKCFAFDAIDNWIYHPQMESNHKIIEQNYKIIEEKADIIFTVSQALTKVFEKNENRYWIANGVDTDFFATAINQYIEDRKITVGYVGKIQERVDFDLVEMCLNKYDKIKFIFMGPNYSQKGKVRELQKKYSNIKFVGDIYYTNLPLALKNVDLAIIPHKVNLFTESMNPLKMYEYLAAGKPVITTGVAGTENISEYIYTANSTKFVELLGIVAEKVKHKEILPSKVASSMPKECSWICRSNKMLTILQEKLG